MSASPSPSSSVPEVARRAGFASAAVDRGIEHCRRGEWHSGLHYLREAEQFDGDVTLPGLFYSYLGHAVARCERRHDRALELCERALALEFFRPETFENLGWARLLAGDRRGAHDALARGFALDPAHRGLRLLERRLGIRRQPVLRFLPRTHPLNRRLGRLRHAWLSRVGG